jgi:nucleoside-diphosphate-sugar epimerase
VIVQTMKTFVNYLRNRVSRRLSLGSLGPNEARIAFDLLAAGGATVLGLLFFSFVLRAALDPRSYWCLLLPLAFVLFNTLYGIYSSWKTAPARVKSFFLVLSIASASAVVFPLCGNLSLITLWVLLVTSPVVLARILLGLPYSKHRDLKALVVNRHGPVLVIGGAGYIGSHAVHLLLEAGRKVRVLDRLMYGSESLREFFGNPDFELIEGDVTDITKLTAAMRNASGVVHLAGLVGDPACAVDPEFTRHANIVATRMAKDVAQSLGIHRFIFASSCSVYGVSDKEVSENGELHPVSLYAQTKIDSERELLFTPRDDFFVTVLRFATVFGHSRRPRFDLVANLFAAQAMTNGLVTVIGPHQWRPFIHVRDLARAILTVLDAEPAVVQDQIFNVGDRRLNMTILQVAEAVKAVAGRHRDVSISVDTDQGDRRNYAVSFEKIRTQLGFEAKTLMDVGIQEMVNNFLAGRYKDFRDPVYSNLATTRQALLDFYDPAEMAKLYGPLKVG